MPSDPYIQDRADGCRDHFCIARKVYAEESQYRASYHEFYNKGQWCSAGEVFIGRKRLARGFKRMLCAEEK